MKKFTLVVCFISALIAINSFAQKNQINTIADKGREFASITENKKMTTKSVKSQSVGKPQFETHYDKNHNDSSWVLTKYLQNSYYANGSLQQTTFQNAYGTNQYRENYYYNKFGSDTLFILEIYDSASYMWNYATKTEIKRDAKNNLLEEKIYNWNGSSWVYNKSNFKNIFNYNSAGFITEKITMYWDEDSNSLLNDYKLINTYTGNLLTFQELKKYDFDLMQWVDQMRFNIFYDVNGVLTGYNQQHYENGVWRNEEQWANMIFLQNKPIDWSKDWDDYSIYIINKVSSFNINTWDTLTNIWVPYARISATWDNYNGYITLYEEFRNNIWVWDEKNAESYDAFGNYIGYYMQEWRDTAWVYTDADINEFTYNSDNTISQTIHTLYKEEDDSGNTIYIITKKVYADFQYFTCQAAFGISSSGLNLTFTDLSTGSDQACYWQFGDGYTSRQRNPTHTYSIDGFYKVSLSIFNPITQCFDKKDSIVAVGNPWNDCQALFTFTDGGGTLAIFTNASLGTGINSYLWNFGDGQTSTLANPTHTYATDGFYDVCLTIGTSNGCFNTKCMQIAINNGGDDFLPYFNFSIDSTGAKGRQQVSYKGATFGDPAKSSFSIEWDFGDGTNAVATFNTQHIYANEGIYLTTLTLKGATKTRFCVELVNLDPSNNSLKGAFNFLLDTTSKANSYPVSYKGATFGDPARIMWNFGDGNSDSTTLYPTHIYADTGMYNVCLTVSDPLINQTYTYCDMVRVGSTVGISKPTYIGENNIIISPNPTKDYIKLEIPPSIESNLIELFDIHGKVWFNSKDKQCNRIEVAQYPKGIYILRLHSSKQIYCKKVIIL